MRSMGHNKQERKRKEKERKEKKEEQKISKQRRPIFEVTMSVEMITFKKLGFFRVYFASFFFSSTP